ncbi:MAG: glycosyl transferase family 1 [Glaciihabitans sp.]|nr:glycosyl transferase family 1 [Glaciihabitans sp.]
METAAVNLHSALARIRPVRLIKYGWSNKLLPLSLPLLFLRTLVHARRSSVILLQDGVLAPMGVVLGWLTRKPVAVIIHGLEVTHTGGVHRRLMRFALPRMAQLIAVSENTKRATAERFPALDVRVANNGVADSYYSNRDRAALRAEIARITGEDPARVAAAVVLVTVGRLVPRKGVAWFIGEVLPLVVEDSTDDFLYLVVGTGAERDTIAAAVESRGQQRTVRLLGGIDQDDLVSIYNGADAFVMPNVPTPGDIEGFGLVALEASSTGTPVVATAVDGVPDAVHDPGNGHLVPALDAAGLAEQLRRIAASPIDRKAVRQYTLDTFSWDASAAEVSGILDAVIARRAS